LLQVLLSGTQVSVASSQVPRHFPEHVSPAQHFFFLLQVLLSGTQVSVASSQVPRQFREQFNPAQHFFFLLHVSLSGTQVSVASSQVPHQFREQFNPAQHFFFLLHVSLSGTQVGAGFLVGSMVGSDSTHVLILHQFELFFSHASPEQHFSKDVDFKGMHLAAFLHAYLLTRCGSCKSCACDRKAS